MTYISEPHYCPPLRTARLTERWVRCDNCGRQWIESPTQQVGMKCGECKTFDKLVGILYRLPEVSHD